MRFKTLFCFIFVFLTSFAFGQAQNNHFEIQLYDREFPRVKREKYYFNRQDYNTLKQFDRIVGLGFTSSAKGTGDPTIKFNNLALFHFWAQSSKGGDNQFVVASDYNCCAILMPNVNNAKFFDKYNKLMKKHSLITPLFNRIDNVKKYISYISIFNSTIPPVPSFAKNRFYYIQQEKRIYINYGAHSKLVIENVNKDEYNDFKSIWQKEKIHFFPYKNQKNETELKPSNFAIYEYTSWGSGCKTVKRLKLQIFYNGEIVIKEIKTVFSLKKHHKIVDKYL